MEAQKQTEGSSSPSYFSPESFLQSRLVSQGLPTTSAAAGTATAAARAAAVGPQRPSPPEFSLASSHESASKFVSPARPTGSGTISERGDRMTTEVREKRGPSLGREMSLGMGSTEQSNAVSGIPAASDTAIVIPSRSGAFAAVTTGAGVAAATTVSSSSSDDDMTDTDENVSTLLDRESGGD